MKGDQVSVLLRAGEALYPNSMTAVAAGRTVSVESEKDAGIMWLVVKESTRGGTLVREQRFQMTDVVMWEKTSG